MAPSSLVRKLGPLERLFYLMDKNRSTHFALAFEVSGPVSSDQWHDGLRTVQSRHPLLSASIQTGEDGSPEFHRSAEITPIPIRLVEGPPSSWTTEAQVELSEAFDTGRAPLLRTVLIQEGDRSVMMFVAHHSIADGRGIRYVFLDVLAAISGEPLDPYVIPPPAEELIDRLLAAKGSSAAAPPPSEVPNSYAQEGLKPTVSNLSIDPTLADRLRSRARAEKTTIHGAVCAAAFLAGRSRYPSRFIVASPIDTRQQLDAGSACAFYLAPGTYKADVEHPSFWHLARDARTQTALGRSDEALRTVASMASGMFADNPDVMTVAHIGSALFACDVFVTNLGNWPFPNQVGNVKVGVVHGPALLMGFDNNETIGVATSSAGMSLTQASFNPLPSFLDSIAEALRGACD